MPDDSKSNNNDSIISFVCLLCGIKSYQESDTCEKGNRYISTSLIVESLTFT